MTCEPGAATAPWHGGWHRNAARCISPNANERPAGACVDLIVVHSISLPPGIYGGGEIFALFTNTLDTDADPYFDRLRGLQVSSHFLIRRDGAIWQFVSCEHRAWHAGRSAYRGRIACNDDSVGIELEGLEGRLFEAAQYRALVRLCVDLKARYPIRHVAGHSDIAPGRKRDPGDRFDWQRLRLALGWSEQRFPKTI